MQGSGRQQNFVVHFGSITACVCLVLGCATTGGSPSQGSRLLTDTQPAANAAVSTQGSGDEDMEAKTRAMAARLAAAVENDDTFGPVEDDRPDPFAGLPPLKERGTPRAAQPTEPAAAATTPQPKPVEADPIATTTTPANTGGAVNPSTLSMTRTQLINRLADQVKASDDPALAEALTAVGLSLADPGMRLDERLLEPLRPSQREAVRNLHTAMVELRKQLAKQDAVLTRNAVDEQLTAAFGQQPIAITRTALCRSVSSYGVYEKFEYDAFLAGASSKAIVYVELDDFHPKELSDGRFEVRLKQELILYNEGDGLAVWRHEPVQVVDVSQNRRRDFYMVQMITLPPRLRDGKYRLKVRVTDHHGGTVDETTMPIRIVADRSAIRE